MPQPVLAFSGVIGSGKSSLARVVSQLLRCPRVSFGDYVRAVARTRGLDRSRKTLQALGESLIAQDVESFCAGVISQVDWQGHQPLVIDGLRHIEVLNCLRKLVAPNPLYLIYIFVDDQTRAARFQARGQRDATMADVDGHSTEVQVTAALPKRANLLIDGTRDVDEAAEEVVSWINDSL